MKMKTTPSINIASSTVPQLTAFYNLHAGLSKAVTFRKRAAAVANVEVLLASLAPVKAEPSSIPVRYANRRERRHPKSYGYEVRLIPHQSKPGRVRLPYLPPHNGAVLATLS